MFGLVDCNNFYASCERIFKPHLEGKPVVVLSNNDGCVIARSNEAKAIGIKMGAPAFQIKELIQQHQVAVFSSNYALYGDLSSRVMNTLMELCPGVEVYSIDESFIDFTGMDYFDLESFALGVRKTVRMETGIPVSIGIAPTKTLAKMANKIAKKGTGAFAMDSDQKRIDTLKNFDIGDVWGIGRQYATFLQGFNIKSAYDLSVMPDDWVKKHLSVVGLRLATELRGISCYEMSPPRENKKNICTSRSFGAMLTDYVPLSEAVATHANTCAQKLRDQDSSCNVMTVFIHTNQFRKDLKQYARSIPVKLPVPTNSGTELVKFALQALKLIYKSGYSYKKAGVIVSGLVPSGSAQTNLFDTQDRTKDKMLYDVVDLINKRFGKDLVKPAALGTDKRWKLKQEKLSPCYTTRWSDIPIIKIK